MRLHLSSVCDGTLLSDSFLGLCQGNCGCLLSARTIEAGDVHVDVDDAAIEGKLKSSKL
jgi:hypothetical protein